jgi:hypothetical protein
MFRGKSSIFGFSYMHYIKITTKSFFRQRLFLYSLGYFEKNIFDEIDNKAILKYKNSKITIIM